MRAKQCSETLFVRIPAALKQQLEMSAARRGTPVSREVVRLLQAQLDSPVAAEFKLEQQRLEASACKGQIEAMEALVLACAANKDARAGRHQLELLADRVLEMRKRREENRNDIQRRLEEQALALAEEATPREPGVFAGLVKPTKPEDIPAQLQESERRRVNLLAVLERRPRGTRTRLAAALGCSRAYVSQMLAAPSSTGYRTISKDVARLFEKSLKLEKGALDKIESQLEMAALQQASFELSKTLRKLGRLK